MSTTTSPTSTNSRAPCLSRQPLRHLPLAGLSGLPCTVPEGPEDGLGDGLGDGGEELRLPTMLAVLTLCYLTNHVPVLVSSATSHRVSPVT